MAQRSAISLLGVLLLAGCGRAEPPVEAPEGAEAAPPAAAQPATVTPQQFATLRWLEGRWKGTMPDGNAFYEGYRMVNDSTLASLTYPDSVTAAASDSGEITLRGGVVRSGNPATGYVVTELSDGRVHFEPSGSARNNFTWVRASPDAWDATLRWPATAEQPAREVVYPMRRIP